MRVCVYVLFLLFAAMFGDCIISKNSSNAVSFFRGKSQATFGCYTSPSSQRENQSRVYIISVMNEKQSLRTLTVNVTTRSSDLSHVTHWPVKLVLASYYPVHWSVATDSKLKLNSVIQVRKSFTNNNQNGFHFFMLFWFQPLLITVIVNITQTFNILYLN